MKGLVARAAGAIVTLVIVAGVSGPARAALDTTPPSVPANLHMLANTETTITMAWDASTDSVGVDHYVVFRNITAIANVPATASPSYKDKGLWPNANNTYTVSAVDAAGNESAVSASAGGHTTSDTKPPTAPTNLTATFNRAAVSVAMTWGPSTDNVKVDRYEVYRNLVKIASLPAPQTSYTDTSVAANASVKYLVVAVDAFQYASPSSNAVQVITDIKPPTAPANLHVTAATSSSLSLAWSPATDNFAVASYEIYRNGVKIANQSWTTGATYYSGGLAPATTYSYVVVARDATGNSSPPSNTASSTTNGGLDNHAPTAPPGAIATVGSGSVHVAWTASTDNVGVVGYAVLRNGVWVATPTGLGWTDASPPTNAYVTYAVKARDWAGNWSALSSAAPVYVDTLSPSTPAAVKAAPTGTSVGLTWKASTDNRSVRDYIVRRNGSVVATPKSTAWTDPSPPTNAALKYTVQARDLAGNKSPQSASAATMVDTQPPTAPSNLNGSRAGDGVALSWLPATDNVAIRHYVVVRDGVVIGTTQATGYADTTARDRQPHVYKVAAVDRAGNKSLPSNAVELPLPSEMIDRRVDLGLFDGVWYERGYRSNTRKDAD